MAIQDHLSIQLYTMRSLDDLDRILDIVADAGYRHVETVGSHLDHAADTYAKLAARGLTASSSHVGMEALRARPDAVVDACRTIKIDQLFMPAVPPEQRDMAADGWRALGKELGGLAEQLRGQGITLGYHNHEQQLQRGPLPLPGGQLPV
ncbi:MAG: sugar phosphate isomerase/epimerase, partial [Pseudomonadota bacterium]